ncbi:NAD(P)-dependent oxidoreductase [Halomonas ramblicola]|uniref:NAD(P)-dependent oxidoreductase n=1 Tax=Halomonas ramblicola TaxID=747349 RepID=UPI0025B503D3|nr:NAD(P)-dependent oxidoreductase [Halomonas ramblicola]MDN3522043.1 NAD(P)-dependent oxidoreductase [Halomonas ramblicola]
MIKTVTVIGLGNMGRGMAMTLHRAGFAVQGSDIATEARERLAAEGIATAAPEALAPSDAYLLSLPTSAQVREVLERCPGLLERAPAGSLIIDTSTGDPAESRQLAAKVAEAGLAWLDTPVSGGPSGAHSGQLGMLVGGETADLERARPLLEAMAARITHVGAAGSGHVVKLANNYLCAAHLLTTAEAVAMAQRAGVDPEACLNGLNSGSGRSAVSEVNFPRWILSGGFDSGFTMGLMRKDLRLAQQAARDLDLSGGLLEQVVEAWHDERHGLDDAEDFNRITARLLEAADRHAASLEEESPA